MVTTTTLCNALFYFHSIKTWNIRRLVNEMIDPAYYIKACQILHGANQVNGLETKPSPMEDSHFLHSSINHQVMQFSN